MSTAPLFQLPSSSQAWHFVGLSVASAKALIDRSGPELRLAVSFDISVGRSCGINDERLVASQISTWT